jgi:hypothetical protein
MDTRRKFLAGLMVVGATAGLSGAVAGVQSSGTVESGKALHAAPNDRADQPTLQGPTMATPDPKTLAANQAAIKLKVQRMYELIANLKAEVDKTDVSKQFSTTLFKEAQEIEKLAKDVRTLSKG